MATTRTHNDRTRMLLDTSGLLAFLFDAEPFHALASRLLQTNERKITHNYVLAELVALTISRRYPRLTVLEFLDDIAIHPLIDVVWVDVATHEAAVALLKDRADKLYSLCDAVSFAIMRQRRVATALTTDRHFVQEGFIRLLET